MEFEFFRLLVTGSRLFFLFHNVIDGLGRLFLFLLFGLVAAECFPADNRKPCNMYDNDAEKEDADGENCAPTLHGEKYHIPIITVGSCHKMPEKSIFFLVFGKRVYMDRMISEAEAAEFEEFQRTRREAEAKLTLRKLIIDASKRETDRSTLSAACESAKRLHAFAVLVSPVNVSATRRRLGGSESKISCIVGGTGESIIPIKKKEAKRAIAQGAGEIRLVPCYSALFSGNTGYLKREVKKVRRAAKKCRLVLSLDDHALTKEEIERGLIVAAEGKADAVSVRGEVELALAAVRFASGRFGVEASGVENAEQLRLLLRTGVEYVLTGNADTIAEETYRMIEGRRGEERTELRSEHAGTKKKRNRALKRGFFLSEDENFIWRNEIEENRLKSLCVFRKLL